MDNWEQALDARDDLAVCGDNALGLFALALRYQIDDLHSIAADAITDGSDDKKCDMLHIDPEEQVAVVAQCYRASKQKSSASANKASDLNTALHIKGISIVNGAQTTGAIGSLKNQPDPSVMVPARFVQTSDPELVRNIIQFNNSQNKITASDFRSSDRIQKKLKEQVSKIPYAEYEGGRRGGHLDVITRNKNLLPSYTVGQALASFHGDPVIAYNQKSNIWIADRLYSRYFNDETTGSHLVCVYSLLRAVEDSQKGLVTKFKMKPTSLTEQKETLLEYFRHRGSTYLLVSAIAGSLETILGHKVPNRFRLSFGDKTSPEKGKEYWSRIVAVTSPFTAQLTDAFSDGLKNMEKVNTAQKIFRSLVQATGTANREVFIGFPKTVSTEKK